jgi:hypothetical protein
MLVTDPKTEFEEELRAFDNDVGDSVLLHWADRSHRCT